MNFKFNNLSGRRFGKLLVLERDYSIYHKRPYYLCRCDCGNEKIICGVSLTRKRGNTTSCGCMVGKYNKLKFGEASFNSLFGKYRWGARIRGLGFKLTKNQFRKFTKQNCYYCGDEPSAVSIGTRKNGGYRYNGVDRVDNSKGYTMGNCVSCCGVCNRMKRSMGKDEFIKHIFKINDELRKLR